MSTRGVPREDAQGEPEGQGVPVFLRPRGGRHLHGVRAVVRSARGRLALHRPARPHIAGAGPHDGREPLLIDQPAPWSC